MCDSIVNSDQFLLYDGAMGTMLLRDGQQKALDLMNLEHPQAVQAVHEAYLAAGSNLLCTNTFGANRKLLAASGHSVTEVVTAAVQIAKKAAGGRAKVAVDLGPIGDLMQPMGRLTFDDAYDMFREIAVAGENAGADLAAIETMADLAEVRAAILAVRENTSLPVFVTMTFERGGRTYLGTLPESFAMVAEGLGVTALGVNCSVGPDALIDTVKKLASATSLPLIVKPNAGLPDQKTGAYSLSAAAFAQQMTAFSALGAYVVGGCCGTDPTYIQALKQAFSTLHPTRTKQDNRTVVCTATTTLQLEDSVPIGASLLEEARDDFFTAVRQRDFDTVLDLVNDQLDDGAELLCVPAEFDTPEQIQSFVAILQQLQGFVHIPMAFSVKTPDCLAAALRAYQGKACVLADGDADMDALFPVIMKYGAVLMGIGA